MFFLDSEECYERAARCSFAYLGGTGCGRQRCRDGSKGIVLGGALLTGEVEERSPLCGRRCSRWKDLTTARAKITEEGSHWCFGLAEAFERAGFAAVQFEGSVAEPLQTIAAILLDPNGVACSFVLCSKTR